jgi:hypothetical protein
VECHVSASGNNVIPCDHSVTYRVLSLDCYPPAPSENRPTCLSHSPDKNVAFEVDVCAESGRFGAKFDKIYVSESRQF